MKTLYTITALLCASTAFAHGIEITDAYARSAGESAKSGAAFMVINNTGEDDVTLTGGETAYAERTEVHTHEMNDEGIMKMTEVEGGLTIPAGQCVFLARGGYHVMMLGLTKPMVDGEMLDLKLEFEGSHEVELEVKIDRARGADVEPQLPEGRETCLSASDAMMHDKAMEHDKMDHEHEEHEAAESKEHDHN